MEKTRLFTECDCFADNHIDNLIHPVEESKPCDFFSAQLFFTD
jgi:hypothetical protein